MGSLLGPIEIGSRQSYGTAWSGPQGGRPTTAFPAILCDNVDEKSIDFVDVNKDAPTLERISKLSRTAGRAGPYDPRQAVSCTTVL